MQKHELLYIYIYYIKTCLRYFPYLLANNISHVRLYNILSSFILNTYFIQTHLSVHNAG